MGPDVGALWRDAEARHARGDAAGAAPVYEAIVRVMPAHVPAWLRLSALATAAGRYRDATAYAVRAAGIAVDDPDLRLAVCERLVDVGESRRGHDLLVALEAGRNLPALACAGLAFVAHRLGETDRALSLAERAWALGARPPELASLRATLLLFAGRIGEAATALEAVVRAAPWIASAHWTLSKLRRWSPADNHVPRLEQALARLPSTDPGVPYLAFALFKELEDCGRHDAAWDALQRGCAAQRAGLAYDPAAEAALLARLADLCTPGFLHRQAPAPPGPVPIFIIGQPRSGTTVLERILGAHSLVRDAGELHDMAHALAWGCDHQAPGMLDATLVDRARDADFGLVGRRYLDNTQWRARGRPFYTDKLPRNFLLAGFIHRALPHARIVHMVREPMDTCFSNLKELFGPAYPHTYAIPHMAAHFRHYQALMAHWHAAMPGVVLDVSYEALVSAPERIARTVFDHCGLPWEPHCVEIERLESASATASSAQVREPIQQRYVGQWTRYARQLQPLQALLQA